jgi:hypothetical protein
MRALPIVIVPMLLAGCDAAIDSRVPEAGTDASSITPMADAGPMCQGNNDGVISRDEVVFAPGIAVRYRINPPGTNVAVDVNGQVRGDGTHVWDFSDAAGDLVSLQLVTTDGAWYAGDFPNAQYASRIDPRAPSLGIYHASATSLDLLGVASEDMADGTELRYDTAVPLLRFPLAPGNTWSADAMVVNGMVNHTPIASRDHYDITVDASGELNLGILTIRQALRVRVESTQMFPAGPGTRRIQYLWLTECYGEVARITSTDGEVDPNFTQAAEFRRLGF